MGTRLTFLRFWIGLVALGALPLAAQELVTVKVSTEPSGARYTVDGLQYIQASSFIWPVGSKHVVTIVSPTYSNTQNGGQCELGGAGGIIQYDPSCRVRFAFTSWETGAGVFPDASAAAQTITADAKLGFVRANFTAQYRVDFVFFDRNTASTNDECIAKARTLGPRPSDQGSGLVLANGTCLDRSGFIWASPGAITLQAVPFDGYVFRGWTFDSAPGEAGSASTVNVQGPMIINPRFEPAKRVRLYTNPLGLRLRVDTAEILTIDPQNFVTTYPIPGYFDWAANSRHTLGGISPQVDMDNRTWVFKGWSNGGGQNMVLPVDNQTNVPLELTANFVRGVPVSFLTEPAGLKLSVEGRDNWPSTNFIWGAGMKYSVSAPAEQTDTHGRKYLFKRWSNNGAATQEITPDASQTTSGIRLIATFEAVPQAVVQSSIQGMKIDVDGGQCIAPCRLDRPNGTVLNLAVPTVIPISEVSRYEFIGWTDGSASAERTFTLSADSQTVRANYRVANRLLMVADPGEGATFSLQPASADGFYAAETNVTILAETKPGFRFRRWDGDLSGTFRSGVVSMSVSRLVRALLDRVPFVEPAGVRNAAADLPESGVAAGLIAIYGGSLAKTSEAGPSNPLVQTIGGTVVFADDRLLPLVYVSPEQINAQLPSDLEPGDHKLTVRTDGLPDVTSTFVVVRNAPGLFVNMIENVPFAVALHEDGSPVSLEHPAKPNEMISLLGTGFGPYNRRVVDGFATPATPAATLVDPIEVSLGDNPGDNRVQPSFAGAAPGLTGITTTRFRPGSAGTGSIPVKVIVNGKDSNTVILPVE